MDLEVSTYIARQRLEEARQLAARWHLVESARPPRQPFRVALGLALIRLGRTLAAQGPGQARTADRAAA